LSSILIAAFASAVFSVFLAAASSVVDLVFAVASETFLTTGTSRSPGKAAAGFYHRMGQSR